jgi:hypothetical protein
VRLGGGDRRRIQSVAPSIDRNIERKEKRERLGAEEIAEGDGGKREERKGVWAIKSCPQMTGRNFPLGDLLSPPRPSVNSNQREYLVFQW